MSGSLKFFTRGLIKSFINEQRELCPRSGAYYIDHLDNMKCPAIAATGYAENFKTGGLEIDFEKRVVTVDGKVVHLTIMEYKILGLLSRYVGKVLTYEFILNEVWGTLETKNNQILRVNMANIRRKLEKNPAEPKYILTDVGVGYRMMDLD